MPERSGHIGDQRRKLRSPPKGQHCGETMCGREARATSTTMTGSPGQALHTVASGVAQCPYTPRYLVGREENFAAPGQVKRDGQEGVAKDQREDT